MTRLTAPWKSIDLSLKSLLDGEMKIKTIALSLGLILGRWGIVRGHSIDGHVEAEQIEVKTDTRHRQESHTVVYDGRLIRNKVTVMVDGVDEGGKPFHSEWKGKFNGKDYEVTGDPTSDTRAYTKVNDQTLDMTAKKGGKVVAAGRIVAAADGKSRTVTVNGTTADGKKFTNTAVYRQRISVRPEA